MRLRFVGLLVHEGLRSSATRRRRVLPVYAAAATWLALSAIVHFGLALGFGVRSVDVALVGVSLALPLVFISSILQASAFAGAALERMISRVQTVSKPSELESLLADALGDAALKLAFRSYPARIASSSATVAPLI